MTTVIGIIFFFALIGGFFALNAWQLRGIAPRSFTTGLSATDLRGIFESSVAIMSWTIADTGEPMVAQSSRLTGTRQQIALGIRGTSDGRNEVRIAPVRISRGRGFANKPTALRLRMSRFVSAVVERDPSIVVTRHKVRGETVD